MPPTIEVEPAAGAEELAFDVTVDERGGKTTHRVTIEPSRLQRLAHPGESPQAFIHRCFEFLLARESKESIMSSFDVSVISRYFPEFESEISR